MLLVFSDDWGRHPSSCQHLVRELLPRHSVVWVNTIGMRPPRLDLSTVRRGWEKLRQWSRAAPRTGREESNPMVLSPRMWPWFRRGHDRWLNQRLLLRTLRGVVEQAGEPVYAITTIPIVADLVGKLPVERWTYYCVDDFSVWPGLDQTTMRRMERELVAKCDEIVAVSESLVEQLAEQGREAKLLTHGVDLAFWRKPADEAELEERLQTCERPLAVFWGVVDQRMNSAWINALAQSMRKGTIVLVGPLDNPDSNLLESERVVHLPPIPYRQLPELARRADVLIMPYADLPVTRAMQPLKLKEYLATGKPVVVSDLPSTRSWASCLDVAESGEQFSALVAARLASGVPDEQLAARTAIEAESWGAKAREFESCVTPRNSSLPSEFSQSLEPCGNRA